MATFNKFNQFVRDVIEAKHNFAVDTFRVALTDTAPQATNAVLSDIVQIAAGNGYATGGELATITTSISGGTAKVSGLDALFAATGGTIGPLRYAVLYNDTVPGKPLVSWWDYGTSVTLADTEQLTVRFDTVNGIFTLS
jgi:hypothetical protein